MGRLFGPTLFATVVCLLAASFVHTACAAGDTERHANFVFLIDVSGSMVSKSTMVASADGQQIKLFEALRQALRQIIEDERLIGRSSQISFITFGTKIAEKSNWPSRLDTPALRQKLLEKIQSPQELEADKHGDTYMAGALNLGYEKARQLSVTGDPCTTTFIIMLTDGWDEPPAGAPLKIGPIASKLLAKQRELETRLGANTWHLRVIGLQKLPEKKTGTTTASQLADLIGGEFIDLAQQEGGSVPDRIFGALKRTLAGLKGEIRIEPRTVVDFGQIDDRGKAQGVLPVIVRSCYPEKILGITGKHDRASVTLDERESVLDPSAGEQLSRTEHRYNLKLSASVDPDCPPGTYKGDFRLLSTANTPEKIPFQITVPARIVFAPWPVKIEVRKPGFFWPENTSLHLEVFTRLLADKDAHGYYEIAMSPSTSTLVATDRATSEAATLPIITGSTLKTVLVGGKQAEQLVRIDVPVPALQSPGLYKGEIAVTTSGPAKVVAPQAIPVEFVIKPSAWEEISPLALPMLLALIGCIILACLLWLSRMQRRE